MLGIKLGRDIFLTPGDACDSLAYTSPSVCTHAFTTQPDTNESGWPALNGCSDLVR